MALCLWIPAAGLAAGPEELDSLKASYEAKVAAVVDSRAEATGPLVFQLSQSALTT